MSYLSCYSRCYFPMRTTFANLDHNEPPEGIPEQPGCPLNNTPWYQR